ncbi:N-formylglutamate amidohydrolase [Nitratireductor aquibiodomus RA22]|uniref:N-formylglutamate amidohydrolase n=1 Tax=Nitratireductor aquibiodomus RA22 TaxID=1189611 RepID=I5BX94_9HYPH|nr:N-formylglutamate amidohydrolase [Nitratireductor aquibiodomus]EIM74196.1 N-formylglutamate amidohydrolase [Nitratireductor aquibiodomus RA22]
MARALLVPSDGEPFQIERIDGQSPVILVCEHASRTIPRSLSTLGAKPDTLTSHAAWDIGALATAQKLSALLDAPLIHQRFSRLVYDCNRPPEAPDAIPEMSEVHAIPGNRNLPDEARQQRIAEIYEPFRQALADLVAARTGPAKQPVIVTIHSFTRVYFGIARHRAIGLLHDRDRRLADAMLQLAENEGITNAMRNYPYGPDDGVTHTLRLHAVQHGLLNVMIEYCSDLIDTEPGQDEWAGRTARLLEAALQRFHIDIHAAGPEQA